MFTEAAAVFASRKRKGGNQIMERNTDRRRKGELEEE
jgi:hypothetical protein